MMKKVGSLALLALAAACAHQPALQPERRYTMTLGANRAGSQVTRVENGRWLSSDFRENHRRRLLERSGRRDVQPRRQHRASNPGRGDIRRA
jgi:hypothetical protein